MEKVIEGSGNLNFEKQVDLDAIKSGKTGVVNEETGGEETGGEGTGGEGTGGEGTGGEGTGGEGTGGEETGGEETGGEETGGGVVNEETGGEETGGGTEEEDDLEEGIVDLNKSDSEDGKDGKEKKDAWGDEVGYITFGDKKLDVDTVKDELYRLKSIEDAIMEDEFLLGFIKHYDAGGDPAEFIKMSNTNYEEVSDIDMLREEFYKENSYLESSLRDKVFASEMKQKYGYDVYSNEFDDEAEDHEALSAKFTWEAKKLKAKRIEDQKKFKSNSKKGPIKDVEDYTAIVEKRKKRIGESPDTKDLSESGFVPVSVGDSKFGIKISDPQKIIDMAADTGMFAKAVGITADGIDEKADLNKFFKIATMAIDPEGFEKKLISIGRTLERRERMKESKNLQHSQQEGQGNHINTEKKLTPKQELLKAFAEKGENFVI